MKCQYVLICTFFNHLLITQIESEAPGMREMVYMQDQLHGCLKNENRHICTASQVRNSVKSVRYCVEKVFRYCLKDMYHVRCTSRRRSYHKSVRLYAMCVRLNVHFNSTMHIARPSGRFMTFGTCDIRVQAGEGPVCR